MIETFFILSIINILIFFNFTKISKIINLYDMPNKNLKIHKNKTSLIGGSIIMLNIKDIGKVDPMKQNHNDATNLGHCQKMILNQEFHI